MVCRRVCREDRGEKSERIQEERLLHDVLGERGGRNRFVVFLILSRCQRDRKGRSHGAEEDTDHQDHGREEQAGECHDFCQLSISHVQLTFKYSHHISFFLCLVLCPLYKMLLYASIVSESTVCPAPF